MKLSIKMKPIFCALFVLVLTVGTVSAASWDSIGQAWQQYLLDPSTENAAALYDALPADTGQLSIDTDTTDILDSIYDSLGVLGYQIEAGDRNAVRAGYRLFTVAAGDFGDFLDVILGGLIRVNPQLFLEELKNHLSLVPNLQMLVGSFGPDISDSGQAESHEAKLRIRALESVTIDSLVPVRDSCIAALRGESELEVPERDQN